jgi:DNA-binding IclR family transcriptional regulator
MAGSKSIERVGHIMRALERGPPGGMSTAEIADATGFDRATTHRAIVSLERIGFIDRDPRSRTVRLGVYMFSLGAKIARRFSVLEHAREAVAKLADQTGDTVFLAVRNKFDSVCIDRRSGNYPFKAQTLNVGDSLPLGVSTGGLAILAAMSDEDVRHVVQYNAVSINEFHRVKPHDIYKHVQETRRRGYAVYFGQIVSGMGAVGYAIKDARGRPLAAISVSAVLDRLTDDRIKSIAQLIFKAVAEIEQRATLVSPDELGDC